MVSSKLQIDLWLATLSPLRMAFWTRPTSPCGSPNARCSVSSEACRKVEHMFMPTTTSEAELERLNPRERSSQIGQFCTSAPIARLMAEVVPSGQRLSSVRSLDVLFGTPATSQSIG
jgi:hypothetical protein